MNSLMKRKKASQAEKLSRSPLQKKIIKALRDGSVYSDRQIARRLGTSHVTVVKVRREFPQYSQDETVGIDGRRRRRKTQGFCRDINAALQRLDEVIGRFTTAMGTTLETAEKVEARKIITDWVIKINNRVEPFLSPVGEMEKHSKEWYRDDS